MKKPFKFQFRILWIKLKTIFGASTLCEREYVRYWARTYLDIEHYRELRSGMPVIYTPNKDRKVLAKVVLVSNYFSGDIVIRCLGEVETRKVLAEQLAIDTSRLRN